MMPAPCWSAGGPTSGRSSRGPSASPAQLRAQLRRRDPIAIESTEREVWLVGGSSTLRQQLVDGLRATITVEPGRDG